jgi:hypothetical protein
MSTFLSRRAFATVALLGAAGALLSACGKKGAPLPPPDQPSTFPRVYPAPSVYPHPAQPGGTTTQTPPPERQQPTADGLNSDTSGSTGTTGQ